MARAHGKARCARERCARHGTVASPPTMTNWPEPYLGDARAARCAGLVRVGWHEQAGILLEGKLKLTIGDETRTLESGAIFFIPANVPHQAIAHDGPAVVLDAFSPIRED